MYDPYGDFDDLTVVSGRINSHCEIVLLAIIRNEMFFLPEFLRHYRGLGVKNFVFLDDRSNDGTREYLSDQTGVMVVESKSRFGDVITWKPFVNAPVRTTRMVTLWRNLLGKKYAQGKWTIQLDADEFLRLPPGMDIKALTNTLDQSGARLAWGIMLDMYPARISDLETDPYQKALDLSLPWFFDGVRHLRLRNKKNPVRVYAGSRARLLSRFGVHPSESHGDRLLKYLSNNRKIRGFNSMAKPALLKWKVGDAALYDNCHAINFDVLKCVKPQDHLLPIQHYKFSGDLVFRIQTALKEKMHFSGSRDYRPLESLMVLMHEVDAEFTCANSVLASEYGNYLKTGNAIFP